MTAERLSLAGVIGDFAEGRIAPRELTARLVGFVGSRDSAVHDIALTMEVCCEDDKAPAVAWSREGWNMLQRSLLFLRSDTPFGEEAEKWSPRAMRWSWGYSHWLVAGTALCSAWLFLVSRTPYAYMISAVLTMVCTLCRAPSINATVEEPLSVDGVPMDRLYPFESARQLLRVRRQMRDFAKKPYPVEVELRFRKECGPMEAVIGYLSGVLWCVAAWPLVLLVLCIPNGTPFEATKDDKSGSAALETKR